MSLTTGAILAGGLGTRLRTVINDRPKVLAPVAGKPFLAHLLDQLADAGIERVVLMIGHRAQQVQDAFGETYREIRLDYSVESAPLGTAGALRLALPKLFPQASNDGGAASAAALVMNGDSYCAADLSQFDGFHRRTRADASLVLARVPDTSRFGKVEMAAGDRLERFLEKQEARGTGWINAGIYLLSRDLIEEIPTGRAVSLEREMFPGWIKTRKLLGFRTEGSFLDIGTPESYQTAEEFLLPFAQARECAANSRSAT